jgi:hypothetical protein
MSSGSRNTVEGPLRSTTRTAKSTPSTAPPRPTRDPTAYPAPSRLPAPRPPGDPGLENGLNQPRAVATLSYITGTPTDRDVGGLSGSGTKVTTPEPPQGKVMDVGIFLGTP